MMSNSQNNATGHTPEAQKHLYKLNEATGYYNKESGPIGFNKLPFDLKVEKTQKRQQIKSELIIQSRIKEGKRRFFTGLLPTRFKNWYFGDHFEYIRGTKRNSFILFQFAQDQQRIKIYFFNHYKLYPAKRDRFIKEYIDTILRPKRS